MRVSPNYVYHLSCFTCVKCHIPLVKGDRYVLFNGQPFCEKDNPLKSTTNPTTPKRGTNTSKRGAKAAARTFSTPSQYHQTGHITVLNNHHNSSTITHSLLSNNSNGLTSTSDELY
jgi:hypothetical protein